MPAFDALLQVHVPIQGQRGAEVQGFPRASQGIQFTYITSAGSNVFVEADRGDELATLVKWAGAPAARLQSAHVAIFERWVIDGAVVNVASRLAALPSPAEFRFTFRRLYGRRTDGVLTATLSRDSRQDDIDWTASKAAFVLPPDTAETNIVGEECLIGTRAPGSAPGDAYTPFLVSSTGHEPGEVFWCQTLEDSANFGVLTISATGQTESAQRTARVRVEANELFERPDIFVGFPVIQGEPGSYITRNQWGIAGLDIVGRFMELQLQRDL